MDVGVGELDEYKVQRVKRNECKIMGRVVPPERLWNPESNMENWIENLSKKQQQQQQQHFNEKWNERHVKAQMVTNDFMQLNFCGIADNAIFNRTQKVLSPSTRLPMWKCVCVELDFIVKTGRYTNDNGWKWWQ